MGKKPFIDRKKAKHYQLVHRSQRDPLINDSDASSKVLVEIVPPNLRGKVYQVSDDITEDFQNPKQSDIESRVGQAALYGIYFDDTDYDYLQHLKSIGEGGEGATFVEASSKDKKKGRQLDFIENLRESNYQESGSSKKDRKVTIVLPDEVLPSKEEIPIGLFNQSYIPNDIQGFQPDLDPSLRETLEALEDDAFIENDLDDFFSALNAEELPEDQGDYEEEEAEESNWQVEFQKFRKDRNILEKGINEEYDDVRSRTTGNYSMSSSVMHRNDKLRLLDDQFEKIEKEYMDDDGDDSDIESTSSSQVRQDFSQILDEFLDKYEINGRKIVPKSEDTIENQLDVIRQELGQVQLNEQGSEVDEKMFNKATKTNKEYVEVESDPFIKKQAWDCQSILSTYSNLENHPTLIREQPRKKSNIDSDSESEEFSERQIEVAEDENGQIRGIPRSKTESKEEKKQRKASVKAERRTRRLEKKSFKQAFAKEHLRQNKIFQNLEKNLVNAIHLE
ncbi:13638_t:CDS:2 [Cetraspora pellucida]|uniref:13638_t:CDS:1 n=1 Tax=Cetraspora pellucida TaxID=1433469 RepID=A0A9N9DRQ6_9GLOM|nr:13638_t:CDS:2 [Cetraspora pellucida]